MIEKWDDCLIGKRVIDEDGDVYFVNEHTTRGIKFGPLLSRMKCKNNICSNEGVLHSKDYNLWPNMDDFLKDYTLVNDDNDNIVLDDENKKIIKAVEKYEKHGKYFWNTGYDNKIRTFEVIRVELDGTVYFSSGCFVSPDYFLRNYNNIEDLINKKIMLDDNGTISNIIDIDFDDFIINLENDSKLLEQFVPICFLDRCEIVYDDSCSIENKAKSLENIKEKDTFSCILEFEDGKEISIPDPGYGWIKMQNISSDTFSCNEIYEGITHFDGKILFKEYFDGNSKVQRFTIKDIVLWKKLPEKEPEVYGAFKEYPLLYGIE